MDGSMIDFLSLVQKAYKMLFFQDIMLGIEKAPN